MAGYRLPGTRLLVGTEGSDVVDWARVFNTERTGHSGDRIGTAIHVAKVVERSMPEGWAPNFDHDSARATLVALGELSFADPDVRNVDQAAVITFLADVAGQLGFNLVEKEEPRA